MTPEHLCQGGGPCICCAAQASVPSIICHVSEVCLAGDVQMFSRAPPKPHVHSVFRMQVTSAEGQVGS